MASLDEIDAYLATLRDGTQTPQLTLPPSVGPLYETNPPQLVGIAHLLLKPRFLLADPTAAGKTAMTLVAWAALHHVKQLRGLVVARSKVLLQWRRAIEKFLPGTKVEVYGFAHNGTSFREVDREERAAQLARWISGETPLLLSTHHRLALDWSVRQTYEDKHGRKKAHHVPTIPDLPQFVLAIDEAHILRGKGGTMLVPFYKALTAKARYCWALTATPIVKRVDDLHGIFETIRPGTFGPFSRFSQMYHQRRLMRFGKRRHWKVLGPKNLPHLMSVIAPFYLKRPSEVFDHHLPTCAVAPLVVEMGAAQRKVYSDIKKKLFPPVVFADASRTAQRIADQREAHLTARTPGVLDPLQKLLYLQLITDAPEVLGVDVPNAKLAGLLDLLADLDPETKILIYSRFEQVVTVLHKALNAHGFTTVRITGKESSVASTRAQDLFQQDPTVRGMCITSAGGESLDLPAASHVLFYDLPWSWGEFAQVVGRARRKGSAVTRLPITLLGANRTIDTDTLTILYTSSKLVHDTFNLDDLTIPDTFDTTTTTSPDFTASSTVEAAAFSTSMVDQLLAAMAVADDEAKAS